MTKVNKGDRVQLTGTVTRVDSDGVFVDMDGEPTYLGEIFVSNAALSQELGPTEREQIVALLLHEADRKQKAGDDCTAPSLRSDFYAWAAALRHATKLVERGDHLKADALRERSASEVKAAIRALASPAGEKQR